MTTRGLIYVALALAFVSLAREAYAEASPSHWQILPEKSSIEWTVMYGGAPVKGTFPEFTSDIVFDPANLPASKAVVKIAMSKVKTDDKDAAANLTNKDWFDVAEFPLAVFEITKFTHIKDDAYEASAMLTLRGLTGKVTLPFTAKFYDDKDTAPLTQYARVEGGLVLKRVDFAVGQGDWAKTDTIANDVKISIHLEAKQVK